VTEQENEALIALFSEEEIKAAIFSFFFSNTQEKCVIALRSEFDTFSCYFQN
jgi:hypothetical protein